MGSNLLIMEQIIRGLRMETDKVLNENEELHAELQRLTVDGASKQVC